MVPIHRHIINRKQVELSFGYDYQHMTHQPRTMFDRYSKTQLEFFWDANGNLAQMIGCKQNSGRLHEWDVKRNSRTEKSPVDSSRSKCSSDANYEWRGQVNTNFY